MDLETQRIQSMLNEGIGWRGKETEVLTTRDGIAGDTLPSEPTAHSAREVMETGFASTIGIGFVVRDHNPLNGANLMIVNKHDQWCRERDKLHTLMIRAGSR